MESRLKNNIEVFNEIIISVSTLHLVFFTDFVLDKEVQYMYGWSMLGFIVLCIIVNMSFVFYFGFK